MGGWVLRWGGGEGVKEEELERERESNPSALSHN